MIRKGFIAGLAFASLVFALAGVASLTSDWADSIKFHLTGSSEYHLQMSNGFFWLIAARKVDAINSFESTILFSLESPSIYVSRWEEPIEPTHEWVSRVYLARTSITALFLIAGILGLFPALAFVRGPFRRWRRCRRGLCVKCDYDLTGNVSGVCPECGTKRQEVEKLKRQVLEGRRLPCVEGSLTLPAAR
jgi:hypothetical protein